MVRLVAAVRSSGGRLATWRREESWLHLRWHPLSKQTIYVLARNPVNPIGTVVNVFQDTAKEVTEEGDAERAFQ